MKKNLVINEYVRDMNEGTKHDNIITYIGDSFENGAYNIIITIKANSKQRERYNLLLKVCAENNITVVATDPATLKTTLRIDK